MSNRPHPARLVADEYATWRPIDLAEIGKREYGQLCDAVARGTRARIDKLDLTDEQRSELLDELIGFAVREVLGQLGRRAARTAAARRRPAGEDGP